MKVILTHHSIHSYLISCILLFSLFKQQFYKITKKDHKTRNWARKSMLDLVFQINHCFVKNNWLSMEPHITFMMKNVERTLISSVPESLWLLQCLRIQTQWFNQIKSSSQTWSSFLTTPSPSRQKNTEPGTVTNPGPNWLELEPASHFIHSLLNSNRRGWKSVLVGDDSWVVSVFSNTTKHTFP